MIWTSRRKTLGELMSKHMIGGCKRQKQNIFSACTHGIVEKKAKWSSDKSSCAKHRLAREMKSQRRCKQFTFGEVGFSGTMWGSRAAEADFQRTEVASERSWCGREKDLHTVFLGKGWWMRDRRDRRQNAWVNRGAAGWRYRRSIL